MNSIGGEIHTPAPPPFSYLTDSGRSSLRLILASRQFAGKTLLLPDFICASVVNTVVSSGTTFSFYHVSEELAIDPQTRCPDNCALYAVSFFGIKPDLSRFAGHNIPLIVDDVFLPSPNLPPDGFPIAAAFNSFRKSTPAADGSLVKSTFPLDESLIRTEPAPFAKMKFIAKHLKHKFIADASGKESDYLQPFADAEKLLDGQSLIHAPSPQSLAIVFDFFKNYQQELRIRQDNFELLRHELRDFPQIPVPEYPAFFVFSPAIPPLQLRGHLTEKRIYLPIHWPKPQQCPDSPLYQRLISIPVDSRYTPEDMRRVADAIQSASK